MKIIPTYFNFLFLLSHYFPLPSKLQTCKNTLSFNLGALFGTHRNAKTVLSNGNNLSAGKPTIMSIWSLVSCILSGFSSILSYILLLQIKSLNG